MSDVLDLSRIDIITDGDESVRNELLKLFLATTDRTETALQQTLDANDTEGWSDAAHELKGAAQNLGADALGELCQQAETTSSDEERNALLPQIKELTQQVRNLITELV